MGKRSRAEIALREQLHELTETIRVATDALDNLRDQRSLLLRVIDRAGIGTDEPEADTTKNVGQETNHEQA